MPPHQNKEQEYIDSALNQQYNNETINQTEMHLNFENSP